MLIHLNFRSKSIGGNHLVTLSDDLFQSTSCLLLIAINVHGLQRISVLANFSNLVVSILFVQVQAMLALVTLLLDVQVDLVDDVVLKHQKKNQVNLK